jgi:hypothetical protein
MDGSNTIQDIGSDEEFGITDAVYGAFLMLSEFCLRYCVTVVLSSSKHIEVKDRFNKI